MKKNMSTTKKPQKEKNELLNEEIVEALILKYGINQKNFYLYYSPIQHSRKHEWISFENEWESLSFNNPRIISKQEVVCDYCIYQIFSNRMNANIKIFKKHVTINLYGVEIDIETEEESVNFLEKTAKEVFLQFIFMTDNLPNFDTIYYDGIKVFENIINALRLQREKITNASITKVIEIENGKIVKLYQVTHKYSIIYDRANFKYVEPVFTVERKSNGKTSFISDKPSKELKNYNKVAIIDDVKQKFEELKHRVEVFNSNN